jgi:hypothetical protein
MAKDICKMGEVCGEWIVDGETVICPPCLEDGD